MDQSNGCVAVQVLKPIMVMILSQVASGGVSIFYKLAVYDGMKIKILVVYRLVFATIFIVPVALIFERKRRPKLTWNVAFQGLACGTIGAALGSNLYAESLVLTSATYAVAMSNLIPALTLVMAVIFRLERLHIRGSAGKAKIIGTALGIGGAMILTLCKGKDITFWSSHVHFLHNIESATDHKLGQNHVLGSLLALCSCISYASWLIIQATFHFHHAKMSKIYPSYSSTAITCLSGAFISGIYSLCTERNWTNWKLGWNFRLLAAAYMGIIGSGLMIAAAAWATSVAGPLFVSSFQPLALVFVVLVGSLVLNEKLHLGSIIGSVLIVVGLYLVLWGKAKEMNDAPFCSKTKGEHTLEFASPADRNRISSSRDRGEEVSFSPVEKFPSKMDKLESPHDRITKRPTLNSLQRSYVIRFSAIHAHIHTYMSIRFLPSPRVNGQRKGDWKIHPRQAGPSAAAEGLLHPSTPETCWHKLPCSMSIVQQKCS
ncbi:WAT1-related protein At1g25270-like isoform X1 [Primulina huaijiensis]|uniref:WAT1-related protein At1g25270-like isoform X1 n=1 Tax=Primulina huaijiensis TaxID=1492673 RepID=UPI003CC6FD3B